MIRGYRQTGIHRWRLLHGLGGGPPDIFVVLPERRMELALFGREVWLGDTGNSEKPLGPPKEFPTHAQALSFIYKQMQKSTFK